MNDTISALRLTGYAMAHLLYDLHQGNPPAPVGAMEGPDGERHLFRMNEHSAEALMQNWAVELLRAGAKARRSVIVVDGYAELDGEQLHAFVAQVRCPDFAGRQASDPGVVLVVQPYRRGPDGSILLVDDAFSQPEMELDEVFVGVHSHTYGGALWETAASRGLAPDD